MKEPEVHVFIDAQNLIQGTQHDDDPWKIDLRKFYDYLKRKYDAKVVYYFIGAYEEKLEPLYEKIKSFGYILVFREHDIKMKARKRAMSILILYFSS